MDCVAQANTLSTVSSNSLTTTPELKYKPSSIDPCLFWTHESDHEFVYVGVYSDNALVVSRGQKLRDTFVSLHIFNEHHNHSPDSELTKPENVQFLSQLVQSWKEGTTRLVSVSSPKLISALKDNLKNRLRFSATGGKMVKTHCRTKTCYIQSRVKLIR